MTSADETHIEEARPGKNAPLNPQETITFDDPRYAAVDPTNTAPEEKNIQERPAETTEEEVQAKLLQILHPFLKSLEIIDHDQFRDASDALYESSQDKHSNAVSKILLNVSMSIREAVMAYQEHKKRIDNGKVDSETGGFLKLSETELNIRLSFASALIEAFKITKHRETLCNLLKNLSPGQLSDIISELNESAQQAIAGCITITSRKGVEEVLINKRAARGPSPEETAEILNARTALANLFRSLRPQIALLRISDIKSEKKDLESERMVLVFGQAINRHGKAEDAVKKNPQNSSEKNIAHWLHGLLSTILRCPKNKDNEALMETAFYRITTPEIVLIAEEIHQVTIELIDEGESPTVPEAEPAPVPQAPGIDDLFPELKELRNAVKKTEQSKKGLIKAAKNLKPTTQGEVFNPHLERRNRALILLRSKILKKQIAPISRGNKADEAAEKLWIKYEELEKLAPNDETRSDELEKLEDTRKALIKKLREAGKGCRTLAEEYLVAENAIEPGTLRNITEPFPKNLSPLSGSMEQELNKMEKFAQKSKPHEAEKGLRRELRIGNFTLPQPIRRGQFGSARGHRAHGTAYTSIKRTLGEDGKITEVRVLLVHCPILPQHLAAMQAEINGEEKKPDGAPTAIYTVKDPSRSFGFPKEAVLIEYPYTDLNIKAEPEEEPEKGPGEGSSPQYPEITAEDFSILKILGQGACGKVYLAKNETTGALVVFKAGLRPEHDELLKKEFELMKDKQKIKDGRIASATGLHEVIDPASFFGFSRGRILLEIPYVPGKNPMTVFAEAAKKAGVKNNLADQMRWRTMRVLDLAIQISRALETAHEQGVIHLDIKPDNISTAKENGRYESWLLDCGVAKKRLAAGEHITPSYAALETFSEKGYMARPRVDIHAFGVTLGELLLGKTDLWKMSELNKPGSSSNKAVRELEFTNFLADARHKKKTIFPFSDEELKTDESIASNTVLLDKTKRTGALLEIIRIATHPNSRQRYKTMTEMREALECLKEDIIEAAARNATKRQRRKQNAATIKAKEEAAAAKKAKQKALITKALAKQRAGTRTYYRPKDKTASSDTGIEKKPVKSDTRRVTGRDVYWADLSKKEASETKED